MIKKYKINNNGSTMVMAVIAIAFVAMLATMILAASYANIAMKRMENRSKDTFYTAETVVDEIRVGLGYNSIDSLKNSYVNVMSNLVGRKDGYTYIIDNETANSEFRKAFIEEMLGKITANKISFGSNEMIQNSDEDVIKEVIKYLESSIAGYYTTSEGEEEKSARVLSIGKIIALRENGVFGNTIVLKDVVIEYLEEKVEEQYFSKITVDLDITFPKLEVDFTASNRMLDFLEYSLVADQYITTPADTTITISASHIYGQEGIKITDGSNVTVKGNVMSLLGDISNANIVTRKDIVIQGISSQESTFTVNGGDIWCENIVIDSNIGTGKTDMTYGATVDIDKNSKTYVKDDLNIFGKNSKVTIRGEYYGYSHEGPDTGGKHKASSTVIVNGKSSKINFNVDKLIIAGRSYVMVDPSSTDASVGSYMTGESLSVKANQDIYLIPSKYIYAGAGTPTNPMSKAAWTSLQSAAGESGASIVNPPSILSYGGAIGVLNPWTPYTVREVDGMVYLYYNFKDKASSAKFIEAILNYSGTDAEMARLKSKLASNFTGLFSGGGITISDSSSKYTSGLLCEVNNGSSGLGTQEGSHTGALTGSLISASGSTMATDVFVLTSLDSSKRYNIISRLLVDIPEMKNGNKYIVDSEYAALNQYVDGFNQGSDTSFVDSELYNTTITSNILYLDVLASKEYNPNGYKVDYTLGGTKGLIKIAVNRDYIVPDDVYGGIIIANGSVTLKHSFKGLIICTGNINIKGNTVQITTDAALVDNLIRNEYKLTGELDEDTPKFSDYFKAYKALVPDPDEPLKIETVTYKDIVGYDNWRKN